MKSVRNSLLVFSSVILFSGCYTELATVERTDRDYANNSDTTYEEGSTAINNHYYLDDDYRRSRLRVSFHYYYPENTSWIGGYYNSYFNDPYWGMRPWSWTYDPWYGYYPSYYPTWGCPPYYDPWHPYYPSVAYYPGYYPSPVYVNNQPKSPPRIRTSGSTRDGNSTDIRSRPITTLPAETQTKTVRTEGRDNKEAIPVPAPVRKRGNDVSWWDRRDNEQTKEARPVDQPRVARSPNAPEKQRSEEAIPVDRPRETRRPTYTPSPKPSTPNDESRPVERPRETRKPTYTPSPKPSVPSNEAKPVERPRESRRESYNPPQQSTPSSSAPSRGGGSNGSSTSSGGRKRD